MTQIETHGTSTNTLTLLIVHLDAIVHIPKLHMSLVIWFAVQQIIALFLNPPVVWENKSAFPMCNFIHTPQGGSHNVQDWAGSILGMRNIIKKEKRGLTSGISGAGALLLCTDCPCSWDIGGGELIGASLRTSLCAPYVGAACWRPRASNLNITKAMRPKATSPIHPEVNGNCGLCKGSTLAPYNTPSDGSSIGRLRS